MLQCLLWDPFFSPFDLHSFFLTHDHGGTANIRLSIRLLNWDPGDLLWGTLELKDPDPTPIPEGRAEVKSCVFFSFSSFWDWYFGILIVVKPHGIHEACKWIDLAVGATDDCSQYYITSITHLNLMPSSAVLSILGNSHVFYYCSIGLSSQDHIEKSTSS